MLHVVTGRFHPHLEAALVDHLRRIKAADPLAPVALLVPSASLIDGIRRLLAVEHGLSLLNVHLLSFHQLALRLADERRAHSGVSPLRVVDDLFFEQLIRYLVQSRLTGLAPLQHIGHSSGTWAALWRTIRDLKDGGVDPESPLRGVAEGCFDVEGADWLRALFSLYATVKGAGAALEVGTADDLAESVLAHAPASSFLASLREILYYGFYDLTQVQLSLLEAVSAAAPTTLFFPLEEGQAYRFARRFFERHVQPKARSLTALSEQADKECPAPSLSVSSAIGVEEELAATCRAILDLCETNGYEFREIGVVMRTTDSYRTSLQSVFDRHRVPFTTTVGRPLTHEPLCKVLLQLASLPVNDFYRTSVLEVVSSPLYLSSLDHAGSVHYRPEQWRMIVSALRITHGHDEWRRLQRASRSALALDGEADDAAAGLSLDVAPEVVALCWKVVSQVIEACAALPPRGTVGRLLEAFEQLAAHYLRRPEPDLVEAGDPQAVRLHATWSAIEQTWTVLRDIDAIGEDVSWAHFVELLTHALERGSVAMHEGAPSGVRVLDAMAARGLSFKALFVLGLNEKVFPRYIREDPFLRDRDRRVLEATLGFKIDEKLSGYDEELLLFTLLGRAAARRLHLSFQRADEEGRQLASSPYLTGVAARLKLPDWEIDAVPRRVIDKLAKRPAMRLFLPPEELARWMAIQGHDPADLLHAVGRDADLFRHGADALALVEDDRQSLTAFDGQTGAVPAHWARILHRGLAPTPLERYARCPFQYFAADVLRLEPVRLPLIQEPDARMLGTLCHAALRRCCESLLRTGWPAAALPAEQVRAAVTQAVAQAAAECEESAGTGHHLLWELAKEQIAALVTAALADEAERFSQGEPYQPVAFEVSASGAAPVMLDDESGPLMIHGRVDRIDRHRDSDQLRIVDYKYKTGSTLKSEDKNLPQSAARGFRLQPPLYAGLDLPDYGKVREVQFIFLGPRWEQPVERRSFPAVWQSEAGDIIRRTIRTLVEGIRRGRFFILPDNYCETCDYRVACRREHQPSWWRAYHAPETAALRALRNIRIKDE